MSRYWLVLFYVFGACSLPAMAQDVEYTTSCIVEQGEARGYISIRDPSSLSFSGNVYFYIYDVDGQRIAERSAITSVTTSGNHLFEVDTVPVSNRAASCAIDVSAAIGSSAPGSVARSYMTTCLVENGRARGYVQLAQGAALSFSGRVYFYFFEADGDYAYRDFTVASVGVIGRNQRLISEISARSDAYACVIDVSEAVNR